MRIREPGKICDHLWLLGRTESNVYLLEGRDRSMLISGGMSYIVPDLIEQFQTFKIDTQKIGTLLILHGHFDHIGLVPYVHRTYADVEILASSRAWEIFAMPKAIPTINAFSREVAKRFGREKLYDRFDLEWRSDITGRSVAEGDVIELGDLDVRIVATPGHSSCSISAYVPQLRALFPSDAGGIPYDQTIVPAGNSNYTQYQRSLEKLNQMTVDYICADHYGCVSGEEAADYFSLAIRTAAEYRAEMETVYRRTGDIDLAAKQLTEQFYADHSEYLLTPELFEKVAGQTLRHIAGEMKQEA